MSIQDLAVEASKASPPITVSSMVIAGIPLNDWVLVLTGVYAVLQIFFILRDKWWRQRGHKG